MKILALDISTKTGWATFETEPIAWAGNGWDVAKGHKLTNCGLIKLPQKIHEYGQYPWSYLNAASAMAQLLLQLANQVKPDAIIIEETNKAKARYTQKALEWIHCCLLDRLLDNLSRSVPVYYISSSEWRKTLGLVMSKEDKKNNKALKTAKKLAEATGKKLNKAELGIKGSVTKKHVAIRYVNANFGLDMKVKDNDICDAICLGVAYLRDAKICDGK